MIVASPVKHIQVQEHAWVAYITTKALGDHRIALGPIGKNAHPTNQSGIANANWLFLVVLRVLVANTGMSISGTSTSLRPLLAMDLVVRGLSIGGWGSRLREGYPG